MEILPKRTGSFGKQLEAFAIVHKNRVRKGSVASGVSKDP